MDILERYLQAVGQHLPAANRDDVLAELRANLQAQMDDRAEELGRPLTDAEAAAILRAHGNPELVAERYLPQRSLIGPALFPLYRLALRRLLPFVLLIYAIAHGIKLLAIPPGTALASALAEGVLELIPTLLFFVFWVTLVFAIVEAVQYHYATNQRAGKPGPWNADAEAPLVVFAKAKLGVRDRGGRWTWSRSQDWDPMKLPPVIPAGQPRPKSFANRVLDLAVHLLWIAYVLAVPTHPALLLGPGAFFLDTLGVGFAPVWHTFYVLVIVLLLAQLAIKIAAFIPGTHRWMQPMDLVLKALGVAVIAILTFTGLYFVPHTPIADPHKLAVVNLWVGIAFRIALFFSALDLAIQLWKYVQPRLQSRGLAF